MQGMRKKTAGITQLSEATPQWATRRKKCSGVRRLSTCRKLAAKHKPSRCRQPHHRHWDTEKQIPIHSLRTHTQRHAHGQTNCEATLETNASERCRNSWTAANSVHWIPVKIRNPSNPFVFSLERFPKMGLPNWPSSSWCQTLRSFFFLWRVDQVSFQNNLRTRGSDPRILITFLWLGSLALFCVGGVMLRWTPYIANQSHPITTGN